MIKINNSAPYGVFIRPRELGKTMENVKVNIRHMYPKLKRISTDDFKTSKKVGIYLAAFKAMHPKYAIVYQDINGKRDIGGDMMNVDLTPYDFIIATPPCNWWSRANYRRDRSPYALQTKHLLPDIIKKLCEQDKPFIVENVKKQIEVWRIWFVRCSLSYLFRWKTYLLEQCYDGFI